MRENEPINRSDYEKLFEANVALVDKNKYLEKSEMQYKNRINQAIKYMKHYIKVEKGNMPVKIEFKEVIKLLEGENIYD